MKVQLTQDEIENGIPEDPCKCPIALALRKVFPGHEDEVVVHCEMAWVYTKLYSLSDNAIKFISDFDAGMETEPIEFEITEELPLTVELMKEDK